MQNNLFFFLTTFNFFSTIFFRCLWPSSYSLPYFDIFLSPDCSPHIPSRFLFLLSWFVFFWGGSFFFWLGEVDFSADTIIKIACQFLFRSCAVCSVTSASTKVTMNLRLSDLPPHETKQYHFDRITG